MESVALRDPVVMGLNATWTVHLAPTASVAFAQVVEPTRKSPGSLPWSVNDAMCRLPVPLLAMVTVAALLCRPTRTVPKLTGLGLGEAWPAATAPVSGRLWNPRPSLTCRELLQVPVALGRNPTWTTQDAPGASVVSSHPSEPRLKT